MSQHNVTHVISSLETGGAEMMLLKLLGASNHERWNARVVSLRDRGTIGEEVEGCGVPVVTLGLKGSWPGPVAAWRLRRELRANAPSVLLGWMYHGNLAALFGSVLAGRQVPLLWNIRYTPGDLGLEKRTTAAAIRLSARLSGRATRIIYNSRAGATRHEQLGYSATRAVVIPNGFDTERFAPSPTARATWRARLGVSDEVILIGRFGRYHAMKDYHGLLSAAAQLVQEVPGVRFVLAGKNVDQRNGELVALIASLGLGDAVTLLGEVRPTNGLMAALDIACSSSSYGEAFPNVLGEAMACAVPSVVTDVGDSAWIVGNSGAVVPPRNPEALAATLRVFIERGPAYRAGLGAKARQRVIEKFSIQQVLREYEQLFSEVAG